MIHEREKGAFVSTTKPLPPKEKSKIITTHELPSNLKEVVTERFWDKEKTLKKPTLVTGDVALSEGEEAKKKLDEVVADKKSKEAKK